MSNQSGAELRVIVHLVASEILSTCSILFCFTLQFPIFLSLLLCLLCVNLYSPPRHCCCPVLPFPEVKEYFQWMDRSVFLWLFLVDYRILLDAGQLVGGSPQLWCSPVTYAGMVLRGTCLWRAWNDRAVESRVSCLVANDQYFLATDAASVNHLNRATEKYRHSLHPNDNGKSAQKNVNFSAFFFLSMALLSRDIVKIYSCSQLYWEVMDDK